MPKLPQVSLVRTSPRALPAALPAVGAVGAALAWWVARGRQREEAERFRLQCAAASEAARLRHEEALARLRVQGLRVMEHFRLSELELNRIQAVQAELLRYREWLQSEEALLTLTSSQRAEGLAQVAVLLAGLGDRASEVLRLSASVAAPPSGEL